MPADGGEAVRVTRKGGFAPWSPLTANGFITRKMWGTSGLWRMPRKGGEETQVLESVDKQAFAIVSEGIYFIPRPDSPAVIPSNSSTSRQKGFDPSLQSKARWILPFTFPAMAHGSYTRRLIRKATT